MGLCAIGNSPQAAQASAHRRQCRSFCCLEHLEFYEGCVAHGFAEQGFSNWAPDLWPQQTWKPQLQALGPHRPPAPEALGWPSSLCSDQPSLWAVLKFENH